MTHGNPHEEAEHAAHHAADPFDKRVAMSMVVIAALLAGVKVLGHRTHNDTLNYQIVANVHHTKESDQWNFFQAKKNRGYLYDSQAELLSYLGRKSDRQAANDLDEVRLDEVRLDEAQLVSAASAAEKPKPKPEKKKKKGVLTPDDEKAVAALQEKGMPRDTAERVVTWRSQAKEYLQEAKGIEKEAMKLQEEAEKAEKKSHARHEQSFYFDLGELFMELSVVACSVAILTKLRSFWFGGMVVSLFGLCVVASGFWIGHH
jgi:hypothetical protein